MYEDVLSKYKNVVKIKRGGQKTVYKAEDPDLGHVIVKLGSFHSQTSLNRAKHEAQLLRQISSPYYPENYDFKVLPGNGFLIVEELIDGSPLSNCFQYFTDEEQVIKLLYQLVQGLSVLWNLQIAHCDVKPSNILILADKTPKIIDLGIAKQVPLPSPTAMRESREHCTPNYASPEQLKNQKSRVDFRTDQFSLGIVFVQLLLGGQHPFSPRLVGGNSIPDNILIDNWDRQALHYCRNPIIRQVIRRLLAWKPSKRYLMPIDLVTAIEEGLSEKQFP